MPAKKSKRAAKQKEGTKDVPPSPMTTEVQAAHPPDIFPMVVTSATQEMFGCRIDEDVTSQNPYKLLKKEDIVQDMMMRAAVSDFSPIKQIILNYPEDELLLVLDWKFTYGCSFYLVLTPEARDRILKPPEPEAGEGGAEEDEEADADEFVVRSPVPQPWVCQGSDKEIANESVQDTRNKLKFRVFRNRREFGAPVSFSDRKVSDTIECPSYKDPTFSLQRMERDCAVEAISQTRESSTQVDWKSPKNMWVQYEPQEMDEEEKEKILQSVELKEFINLVVPRFQLALQQNEIMDVFFDDWKALGDESGFGRKVDTQLKQYQSFTDLTYTKDKAIRTITWHPKINGVVAVAMAERAPFKPSPSLIIVWSFADSLNPQLLLRSPGDVFAFEFCPTDSNIIIGGCMNGQVVLWDISAHVESLQGTRPGHGKSNVPHTDAFDFEAKRKSEIPVVRYCAASAIDSGHRAPVTDVQWLPETFEVTKMGIPVKSSNDLCVQVVTCAPDSCVMFWDIRGSGEKLHENPFDAPNAFSHLGLSWKPLLKVNLPKPDNHGEFNPLKLSLEENTLDTQKERAVLKPPPVYGKFGVPTGKNLPAMDGLNTKFYVGTKDGEVMYTDWKVQREMPFAKPTKCCMVHDGMVNTARRSPFFKDTILSVGGSIFAIWKEGIMDGPIMQSSRSQERYTTGCWSLSRPAVFFLGRDDGNIEVWDLLEKSHEPSHIQSITPDQITCIRPWIASPKQHFLSASDELGTLHVLEIPRILRILGATELQSMKVKFFDKMVDKLAYFEKRKGSRAMEKQQMEAEQLKRDKEPSNQEKSMMQIEVDMLKDFEAYKTVEKDILKTMGLLIEETPE